MFDRDHFYAAVIGGGAAGAQCALWLKHMGIPAILFEKNDQLGGLQIHAPDPTTNHYVVSSAGMRSREIAGAIHENLSRHGVPFICGAEVSLVSDDGQWFHLAAKTEHGVHNAYAKYVVLASGVQQRKSGFAASSTVFIGSADPRIRSGRFFEGKTVAILGGGDNALECHGFVQQQNPKAAHVFARTLRAGAHFISKVPASDINEGGYNVHAGMSTLPNHHCITFADDPYSRSFYEYLIVNYGFESKQVLPLGVDPGRNERGFVVADEHCLTSNPRVLAIGEASQRMHPCVATAMADGVIAAKTLETLFSKTEGAEGQSDFNATDSRAPRDVHFPG